MFEAIDPAKDVDGFSPVNVGRLVQNRASLMGCTPAGVMEILRRSDIEIAGKRAVVIGRSDIVGKPMALMLLHANATVTICHSRTKDLPAIAREADILVAALGRAAFVTPDFVKPGATVIDVGINRVTDAALVESLYPESSPRRAVFKKNGSLVVGDVHPAVAEIAGAITPVPGGVGPLTIAMLLHNVIVAAEAREASISLDSSGSSLGCLSARSRASVSFGRGVGGRRAPRAAALADPAGRSPRAGRRSRRSGGWCLPSCRSYRSRSRRAPSFPRTEAARPCAAALPCSVMPRSSIRAICMLLGHQVTITLSNPA